MWRCSRKLKFVSTIAQMQQIGLSIGFVATFSLSWMGRYKPRLGTSSSNRRSPETYDEFSTVQAIFGISILSLWPSLGASIGFGGLDQQGVVLDEAL